MTEVTEYIFRIKDFTPATMPLGRLIEYYSEIKKMLGLGDNIHLVGIFESSHGSCFAVDRNHETSLVERLVALNEGTAPKRAVQARETINSLLREDGTSGSFYDASNQNVIQFPGKLEQSETLFQVRDTASFVGELYYIAGNKDDVRVRISTDEFGVVFCKTTRDLGKALRDFLFENVKVSGRGTWTRTIRGNWEIGNFFITEFAPVVSEGLRGTVDRLRKVDIKWPDDPVGLINEIEEKNGQVH